MLNEISEGMARELYALLGERAPPVSMIQEQKQYKQRPKRPYRAAKWERTPFTNEARTDQLVLRHWRRQQEAKPVGEAEGAEAQNSEIQPETHYKFAKYNTQVTAPEYDQAQYDANLTNPNWTKEETDYLVEIYKEYAGRWAIITDRYEYAPPTSIPSSSSESDAIPPPPVERSMEDLKARFYDISAKLMAMQTPLEKMTASEYATYETLIKFSPERETTRKSIANALLNRNPEEVKEEEWLLQELQRITASQARFDAERREIRDRLEYPQNARDRSAAAATGNPAASASSDFYRSSQALQQLLQTLAHADRSKKRRNLLGADGILASPAAAGPGGSSPATATGAGSMSAMGTGGRDSFGGAAQKKGSMAAGSGGGGADAAAAAAAAAAARAFSPRSAAKYAVTTHDRVGSGVTFRTDRILKLRQAKSGAQTQRIGEALAALGVPEVIVLPTQEVCGEFERLVSAIGGLVDLRKVAEKEVGEIKVAREMRRERLRREGVEVADDVEMEGEEAKTEGVEEEEGGEPMEVDEVEDKYGDQDVDGEQDAGGNRVSGGEEDAEGEVDEEVKLEPKDGVETKQAGRGPNRSQSVVSNASRSSRRSRR